MEGNHDCSVQSPTFEGASKGRQETSAALGNEAIPRTLRLHTGGGLSHVMVTPQLSAGVGPGCSTSDPDSAHVSGRAVGNGSVLGPLPPKWKIWVELLAPGFGPA